MKLNFKITPLHIVSTLLVISVVVNIIFLASGRSNTIDTTQTSELLEERLRESENREQEWQAKYDSLTNIIPDVQDYFNSLYVDNDTPRSVKDSLLSAILDRLDMPNE